MALHFKNPHPTLITHVKVNFKVHQCCLSIQETLTMKFKIEGLAFSLDFTVRSDNVNQDILYVGTMCLD